MNDDVATLDVVFEHRERVAARKLEVFLDLDLDPLMGQRVPQRLAIGAELVRHTGEKEFVSADSRRRPRYGRGSNVAWPDSSAKGAAVP